MFPRFSSVIRILIVPVVVCLLFLMLVLQREDVDVRGRPRLPWKTDFLTQKKLQDGALVSTTRHTPNTRGLTESPGEKTATLSASPFINPHNFSYILNPSSLCSDQELYMMIYVHTSPNHFRHRQTIRQTWANPRILEEFKAKIIFVIGMVPDTNVMNAVLLESDRYGDIVQENFVDSYRNLTYKGIAALKWLHFHCNKIKYVLKTDDDMLVNFYSLVKQMKDILKEQSSRVLLCNQWMKMKVIREKKSKWYVPKDEFAPDFFPTYCSGSAFVMSGDVTRDMFQASFTTPFFWVDDYYVTGMLANKIGIKHKGFNSAYFLMAKLAPEKLKNDTSNKIVFYHVHNLVKVQSMWKMIEARHGIHPNSSTQYYDSVLHHNKSTEALS